MYLLGAGLLSSPASCHPQLFLAQGPRALAAAPGLTVLPTWPEAGVALDPLLSSRTGACWQLPLEVKKLGARAEMLTQV